MLIIQINKKDKQPIFRQIFEKIKGLVENGTLQPGDKLPSSRMLAQYLEVNRTTVYRAYEELWSFGYIESKSGSYSTIRKRAQLANTKDETGGKKFNWAEKVAPVAEQTLLEPNRKVDAKEGEGLVNFLPLSPDPKLMPVEEFKKHFNQAISKNGKTLLGYNDTLGYIPLREFICKRLGHHGIKTSLNNIMITDGTHNSIELFLRFLLKPGDKIVVESPTYSVAIPLFNLFGADVIEVPIHQEGVDLNQLEKTFTENEVSFLFTMANFQNPTGITSSQKHREQLLELCKKYDVPILEDGFEEEMKYFGKAVLPIKSMDDTGQVVYLGTFSKTLFPGLRLGWIVAAEQLIQSLVKLKQICSISGNFLSQAAIYEYCQSGSYELHVKRLHRIYRKRMALALKAAEKHLPKKLCWFSKPIGGYSFWVSLKEPLIEEDALIDLLKKNGAAVAPGKLFFVKPQEKSSFRVSISHVNEAEIETGVKIIGEVLRSLKKHKANSN